MKMLFTIALLLGFCTVADAQVVVRTPRTRVYVSRPYYNAPGYYRGPAFVPGFGPNFVGPMYNPYYYGPRYRAYTYPYYGPRVSVGVGVF